MLVFRGLLFSKLNWQLPNMSGSGRLLLAVIVFFIDFVPICVIWPVWDGSNAYIPVGKLARCHLLIDIRLRPIRGLANRVKC